MTTGQPDLARQWRKSSHSMTSNCLEITLSEGFVLIRDSKQPEGLRLQVGPQIWSAFITSVRSGDLLPGPASQ